jgi:hypothetical protein
LEAEKESGGQVRRKKVKRKNSEKRGRKLYLLLTPVARAHKMTNPTNRQVDGSASMYSARSPFQADEMEYLTKECGYQVSYLAHKPGLD